jgi:hypothetical protein
MIKNSLLRYLSLCLLTISVFLFAETRTPVKPSQLSPITNGQLSSGDLFILYDISAGISKKLSLSEMDSRYLISSSGTVTSDALSAPSDLLSVSGSPITGAGTLSLSLPTRAANLVFAGPSTGSAASPTFRSLVQADIPSLSASIIGSGTLPIARGGTNSATSLSNNRVMQSSGGAIVEASAITASRLLVSDANGIPTHSTTTATQAGYLSSVTSDVQTQLDGKQASGDYITALTGDVTASGPGSVAATIGSNKVTNSMLATVSSGTFKGRTTASTGNVEDLTATQATALLNAFSGDSGSGGVKGLVPAPASGDAAANKFLKANGTWTAAGTGDVVGPSSVTDNTIAVFDGTTGKLLKQGSSITYPSTSTLRWPSAGNVGIEWGTSGHSIKYSSGDLEIWTGGACSSKQRSTDFTVQSGHLRISSAGKTVQIAEGSNAKMGQATLSSGTVTVSTTAVSSTTSRIFLTTVKNGSNCGSVQVDSISNGTNFVIVSDNASDSCKVNWLIMDVAS